MKRIDLLIVLVIATAVVASAAGALTYEDRRASAAFLVAWSTTSVDLDDVTASRAGPGDETISLAIDLANLTRLDLEVTIAANAPLLQPAQVRIEVTPPDGNGSADEVTIGAGPGGSITVPFAFDLATVPTVTTTTGADPDAALARLASQHASARGVGTWTIVVQIASGAPGPVSSQEAYGITVGGAATTFAAAVSPSTPEVGR